MICVSNHLSHIQKILSAYGIKPEWLEITNSVQDWCVQKGIEESNPFRAAKCFLGSDSCYIVIQELQTDEMIQSSKQLMKLNGFDSETLLLNTDFKYLTHLLLHEVACYALGETEQNSRDQWAFNELNKYAP